MRLRITRGAENGDIRTPLIELMNYSIFYGDDSDVPASGGLILIESIVKSPFVQYTLVNA